MRLNDHEHECSVRPAADVLFRSVSETPDSSSVLAIVMTGMGEDGRAGVKCLKQRKCHCMTQDKDSCIVYGMPCAIDECGLSDEQVPLDRTARRMTEMNAIFIT